MSKYDDIVKQTAMEILEGIEEIFDCGHTEDIHAQIKEWIAEKYMDKNFMKEIDSLSYEELLRINRFAPLGDPRLQGDQGYYFSKVMNEKKQLLEHSEQVAASKRVGWIK